MILVATSLTFSYGRHQVLHDISFELSRANWLTIVGPNGSGKTTLVRLLLGLLTPDHGEVHLDGHPLRTMSRREIAKRIALLPQQGEIPFGFSVRETVAMGRTPHLGRVQPMTPMDEEHVQIALKQTETEHLSARPITQLSGGEQQRVLLARAFAQDTPVLVLDEPTMNLDLLHEKTLLDQVNWRKQNGTAVVAVLHDLNLAMRYSDLVLALAPGGKVAAFGPPEEVLTPERIQQVFQVRPTLLRDPKTSAIRIFT